MFTQKWAWIIALTDDDKHFHQTPGKQARWRKTNIQYDFWTQTRDKIGHNDMYNKCTCSPFYQPAYTYSYTVVDELKVAQTRLQLYKSDCTVCCHIAATMTSSQDTTITSDSVETFQNTTIRTVLMLRLQKTQPSGQTLRQCWDFSEDTTIRTVLRLFRRHNYQVRQCWDFSEDNHQVRQCWDFSEDTTIRSDSIETFQMTLSGQTALRLFRRHYQVRQCWDFSEDTIRSDSVETFQTTDSVETFRRHNYQVRQRWDFSEDTTVNKAVQRLRKVAFLVIGRFCHRSNYSFSQGRSQVGQLFQKHGPSKTLVNGEWSWDVYVWFSC